MALKTKEAVIGSKEEAMWTTIKKDTIIDIEKMKQLIIYQKGIIELCDQKIEEHKL